MEYKITTAKYTTDFDGVNNNVKATINGEEWLVPLSEDNTFYAEILKWVEAGDLTIEAAEQLKQEKIMVKINEPKTPLPKYEPKTPLGRFMWSNNES